jgi:ech hydrogenase subunit E
MARRTVIPFGPQHPVLPEPLQLRLVLDDEKVVEVLPAIGYVHRGIEKLGEQKDYLQDVFLVERVCGICSFMHALTYCRGIEMMMNVTVPDRAQYLRVVWAEINRLHSHLLWAGLLADSFGFENLFMQLWRCRETVLDLAEATTGGRVMYSTCSVGGVRRDIPENLQTLTLETMDRLEKDVANVTATLNGDYSVKQRTVGVGVLTKDQARLMGAVGPVARASGVAYDLRTTGYAAYGELGVTPITETAGDCYARTQVRVREIFQSIDLVRRAIKGLPAGPISVPVKGNPDGEVVSRLEQPRGEVIYYLRGNGTKNLDRLRIRTPTFANLPPLLVMLPGCELADVPVITLSIDPCISCTER